MRSYKYLMVLTLPVTVYISFTLSGVYTFLPLIYAFGIIPFLELFVGPDNSNNTTEQEAYLKEDKTYDVLLYLIVPIQYGFLVFFLFSIEEKGLSLFDLIGRISGMGIMCGVLGINVAHELGHRSNKFEQFLAKSLLLTSLYMHFFIEHNRGHHKNVSTPEDPASARYGEVLYAFWIRSVINSYKSAWRLEFQRLRKLGLRKYSLRNEMLQFQLIQIGLVGLVFAFFGLKIMIYFISAATIGFLLLETVNYIEHYGLTRKASKEGRYERVLPAHSWNSDHIMGRLLLFELSRHSDHHYLASRKYQILRHMENSPQMPTGYPGMMLLTLIPPLWFAVIHRQMKKQSVLEMA